MIPRKLVDSVADLKMVESDRGYSSSLLGPFFAVKDDEGWNGPQGLHCTVRVVPPRQRSPLYAEMHSGEEMGFVIAGNGHYEVVLRSRGQVPTVLSSFAIGEGSILLAPQGHSEMRFEIFNSGAAELKFIAFQAQDHAGTLKQLDIGSGNVDQVNRTG